MMNARRTRRPVRRRIDLLLYGMLIPGVVLTLIYQYGPLSGLVIAFQRFDMTKGLYGSPWVGLDNFLYLFKYYPGFWNIIRNTLEIALLKMAFNFIVPIVVALMLNEVASKRFKRSIQTCIYLPHFISWVVICGLMISILHPENGIINQLMVKLGMQPVYFLGRGDTFRAVLIISDVWKSFGYGTIIYLAALTGIDPSLYEAAVIDRANRLQKLWYITLPGISHIIILVMTLNMGNVLNAGFDQIFNLYNPIVYDVADILDTFTYRLGMVDTQFDLSTAVSLLKSLVSCLLVSTAYYIAYKKADYRIF